MKWNLLGSAKAYGEDGMQTGQGVVSADPNAHMSSLAPTSQTEDAAPDSAFPDDQMPPDAMPGTDEPSGQKVQGPTPDFSSSPVLSGDQDPSVPTQLTQTPPGQTVSLVARAKGLLAKKVIGVPVWVLGAAAAAWWWRRRAS